MKRLKAESRTILIQICRVFFCCMVLVLMIVILVLQNTQSNQSILLSRKLDFRLPDLKNEKIVMAKVPPPLTARDEYVKQMIRSMSIEEKVGQMFMWKISGTELSSKDGQLLRNLNAGGVIIMGDNVSPTLSNMIDAIHKSNSKIPYFVSIDQEGGVVKRLKSDPNPGAQILKSKTDKELCDAYKQTTNLLKTTGINVNFGLISDIAWKSDSYMNNRAFGNTVNSVIAKNNVVLTCSNDIYQTIKHYPGHGRTSVNSHLTIPVIDIDYNTWLQTDAQPFINGIKNNVNFIMVGHLKYPQIDKEPASLSQVHIQNLRSLGYQNIVITDDMAMLQAAGVDPYVALDKAVDAGNDVILYVSSNVAYMDLYNRTVARVKKGEVPIIRINDSVERILRAKYDIKYLNEK